MNKTRQADELARNLGVRLVYDVAAERSKGDELMWQVGPINEKLKALEKSRADFLDATVSKCKADVPADELRALLDEVSDECENHQNKFLEEKNILLITKEETEACAQLYFKEALTAFNLILAEILEGKFGRGEIIFVQQKIWRVFGRIKSLEEPIHFIGYHMSRKDYVSRDDIKKITDACKLNQRPLIHIAMEFMPLNQAEAANLCREKVEYQVLEKIIPKELFLWKPPFVYLIKEDLEKEIYMAPLNERELVILIVNTSNFPNHTVKVVGKMLRNEANIRELHYFHGDLELMAAITTKATASEEKIALASLSVYYKKKYPWSLLTF